MRQIRKDDYTEEDTFEYFLAHRHPYLLGGEGCWVKSSDREDLDFEEVHFDSMDTEHLRASILMVRRALCECQAVSGIPWFHQLSDLLKEKIEGLEQELSSRTA